MEFRPGSFPTPTKLHLSIFSTLVGSQILHVQSLDFQQFPVWFSRIVKRFHVQGGQEREQLVNTASPQLP